MFPAGNIEIEGKQNSLFPAGPVISVLLYPQLKTRKKKRFFNSGWLTNLQGVRTDHVRVESSRCCFPWELLSFARPRPSDETEN